jgi:chromosome segregation ATPase
MSSKLEADNANLQRQLSLATAKYEETVNLRDVAESKLLHLEHMNENLNQRLSNLELSYKDLSSNLEQVQARESAAAKRVAVLEELLSKKQVIGSCGLD